MPSFLKLKARNFFLDLDYILIKFTLKIVKQSKAKKPFQTDEVAGTVSKKLFCKMVFIIIRFLFIKNSSFMKYYETKC